MWKRHAYPLKIYHVQWETFISNCSYVFIDCTVEYVTTILESTIHSNFLLKSIDLSLVILLEDGIFGANAPPYICHYMNARYIIM